MLGFLTQMFEDASPVATSNMGVSGLGLQVPGHVKPELQRLARLPGHVSRQEVIEQVRAASKSEATAELLQKWVQARLRQANAATRQYQSAAQFQQGILRANERMMAVDQRHGKFVEGHLLNVGSAKAELDGYQQGYQSARTLVG